MARAARLPLQSVPILGPIRSPVDVPQQPQRGFDSVVPLPKLGIASDCSNTVLEPPRPRNGGHCVDRRLTLSTVVGVLRSSTPPLCLAAELWLRSGRRRASPVATGQVSDPASHAGVNTGNLDVLSDSIDEPGSQLVLGREPVSGFSLELDLPSLRIGHFGNSSGAFRGDPLGHRWPLGVHEAHSSLCGRS